LASSVSDSAGAQRQLSERLTVAGLGEVARLYGDLSAGANRFDGGFRGFDSHVAPDG
jgi:hypothetical protein